jgi:hypothetical protein
VAYQVYQLGKVEGQEHREGDLEPQEDLLDHQQLAKYLKFILIEM